MFNKIINLWFFLLSASFFLAPTYAEELSDDIFSLSLADLLQIEVVGSTLTLQKIKNTPSAVTVFTHREIKRMGLDYLDELMNLVPGFQSYRSSASSIQPLFSARGRRIGNNSAEILLLVDGQRLDDARTSGSSDNTPKYPLFNIERVEFIRGSGAAIYGSNAMMGVINIITRKGDDEAMISYGSFNRRQFNVVSSNSFGSNITIDFIGNIDIDDGDDYRVYDTFSPNIITTNDPRKFANFNLKINRNDTQINLRYSHIKVENFYQLSTLSNDLNELESKLKSISFKQMFKWKSVDSWFWLSSSDTYSTIKTQLAAEEDVVDISKPFSSNILGALAEFKNNNETRVQWHNNWFINELNSLQFGLEYRYLNVPEGIAKVGYYSKSLVRNDILISSFSDLVDRAIIQNSSSREILGIYGQYQKKLFSTTDLTLGLRYDSFSQIDDQLTPRIAIVHSLNEFQSIKFLYGTAFRAPAENELNLINNPVVLGNPNLKPESVKTWEIIWLGQWSQTSISLGFFRNYFENSIQLVEVDDGLLQFSNNVQEDVEGIELEWRYELNGNWLFRSSFTYFNKKPALSFRETDRLASLMINYQYEYWNANLIATYSGERSMTTYGNENKLIILDDYWQFFLKLNYQSSENWLASLQIKNLLNSNYRTPPVNSVLIEGIVNRGQEILLSISTNF